MQLIPWHSPFLKYSSLDKKYVHKNACRERKNRFRTLLKTTTKNVFISLNNMYLWKMRMNIHRYIFTLAFNLYSGKQDGIYLRLEIGRKQNIQVYSFTWLKLTLILNSNMFYQYICFYFASDGSSRNKADFWILSSPPVIYMHSIPGCDQ